MTCMSYQITWQLIRERIKKFSTMLYCIYNHYRESGCRYMHNVYLYAEFMNMMSYVHHVNPSKYISLAFAFFVLYPCLIYNNYIEERTFLHHYLSNVLHWPTKTMYYKKKENPSAEGTVEDSLAIAKLNPIFPFFLLGNQIYQESRLS